MTDLPAYLQNLPSRNLAQTAIANVGAGTPPYLSIQGNRFTLIDVAGNTIPIQTLYIDVVIVDVNDHVSKIFFGLNKPYDPNNPTPPACFSDNGIAPSMSAGQPQSPTCASCPQNVWGSKISQLGSQVKQCADQQKIAIYVPDYSEGLFLLRIPAGSFSNWRAYMAKFASAKLDPDRVITRISFEPNTVGTLVFQSPGYITEQMVGVVTQMITVKAAEPMIGRLDRPREATLPSPYPAGDRISIPAGQPAALATVQTGPFVPVTTPVAFQTPSAGPVAVSPTPAAVLPAAPPQRRRRRTQAEMAAARAATSQQPPAPVQAPFRPDLAPAGTQQPPTPVQAPFRSNPAPAPAPQAAPAQQGQFGIVQNPPAPPADLDLDAIFK